jgi:isocitrate/isopropylmalate dehydrogenase
MISFLKFNVQATSLVAASAPVIECRQRARDGAGGAWDRTGHRGAGNANSAALILSTALLLNWCYQKTRIEACRETARLLDLGVRNAIAGGNATPDLGGHTSTDAFATAVIAALEAA